MESENKPKVTCYSEGEDALMTQSQVIRGRGIAPLLRLLSLFHVTPNQLTLLSLVAGLAFCPLLLWSSSAVACSMLLLHLILDGMDGPLARYQKTASSRGSLTDTFADQIVVTFTSITMIHAGYLGVWPGALYLFFYALVVIFALVRNALTIPYSWLVRPRMLVYVWFAVDQYVWPGTLSPVVWIVTLLLAIKTLTGFIKIRRRM
jgi:phosphatidylglycerophosphate synthase